MRTADVLAKARKKILLEGYQLDQGMDLLRLQGFLGTASLVETAELARALCNELVLFQQPDGTFKRHSFLMATLMPPAY